MAMVLINKRATKSFFKLRCKKPVEVKYFFLQAISDVPKGNVVFEQNCNFNNKCI